MLKEPKLVLEIPFRTCELGVARRIVVVFPPPSAAAGLPRARAAKALFDPTPGRWEPANGVVRLDGQHATVEYARS